jgi:hypothetical protein
LTDCIQSYDLLMVAFFTGAFFVRIACSSCACENPCIIDRARAGEDGDGKDGHED